MLVSLRPTFIKEQYGPVPFLMETRVAYRQTPVNQEQTVPGSESCTPVSWEGRHDMLEGAKAQGADTVSILFLAM